MTEFQLQPSDPRYASRAHRRIARIRIARRSSDKRVYDVVSIANTGFSERIITAPSSPTGKDTQIGSKNTGTTFYVTTDKGVVVLDMNDSLKPRMLTSVPIACAT